MVILNYSFLIPLFPFLTFVIIILGSRYLKEKSAYLAIFNMFLSFLLSFGVFLGAFKSTTPNMPFEKVFPWIKISETYIDVGFLIDPYTGAMLLMVSLISLLIHIYSIGYMHGDKGYPRFFAYLSLFASSMLGLVLSNNLLQLLIFWELVGLCSYLLISFWFEKPSAARAGAKAFIVTRFGDLGFLVGILLIFYLTGTLNFQEINKSIHLVDEKLLSLSCILLFCGAVGKSAQFPLHIWLPDAMEGPTPVSALIHAATMVVAGVYIVARMFVLFSATAEPLIIVAYLGAFTALFAATLGVVTNDIKKILAYSTVSQLGLMMAALGIGAYSAGTFHLFTHAFFKALLFLGAGSVIHSVHTQNIFEMGGLRKKMPITFITFLIASLALAGVFPLSGFWSKDEILLSAFLSEHKLVFMFLLLGAFLTAFYIFRLNFLVFWGKENKNLHPHESPPVMTIPLVILSFFAVFLGLVGSPVLHFLYQEKIYIQKMSHHFNISFAFFVTLMTLISIFLAWLIYGKKVISTKTLIKGFPFLYNLVKNKYYIDEFFVFVLVKPTFILSRVLAKFDQYIIDGIVNLIGWFTVKMSGLSDMVDRYVVDGIVNLIGEITKKSGNLIKHLQTGVVQNYILTVVVGATILIVMVFFK